MEELLQNIEWVPVLVSTALAFGLGWLWYSPVLFLKGWLAGIGEPVWRAPMWMPMMAQAGSLLLLAILTNFAVSAGQVGLAVLIGFTIAGFLKASGFYSGKTMWAVSVEVGYIMAVIAVMVGVNMLL